MDSGPRNHVYVWFAVTQSDPNLQEHYTVITVGSDEPNILVSSTCMQKFRCKR